MILGLRVQEAVQSLQVVGVAVSVDSAFIVLTVSVARVLIIFLNTLGKVNTFAKQRTHTARPRH
jgi:hypothetical protein